MPYTQVSILKSQYSILASMKDNFSVRSESYAKFRPLYPKEMFAFILPLVKTKQIAWDCGTGNGQVAHELAKHFHKVHATDISERQIANATPAENIFYKVEQAERTQFPDKTFDLITVAQAIHWFDFDAFYKEVKRVGKQGSVLAVMGYGLMTIDDATDKVIDYFYKDITNPYWDDERKYIDENYQTIPFPFEEIPSPKPFITAEWNFDQLIGFLNTWSAVQHYIKANNKNPVDLVYGNLKKTWKNDLMKVVRFPVLLRVGKINK